MTQDYFDPERANDSHALIFHMTAEEVAAADEDLVYEYMKRREFRFAAMNSMDRSRMLDAIVEEEELQGGWFWQACLPGCLPDGPAMGPFDTYEEALKDARSTE